VRSDNIGRARFELRLPRKRDRELIRDLRVEAARQEMSTAALIRWILRQVLLGQHPARVQAVLTVRRRKRAIEPLPTLVGAAPTPEPVTAAATTPPSVTRGPRDELASLESARERRRRRRA
jgi:plasmid stability protein